MGQSGRGRQRCRLTPPGPTCSSDPLGPFVPLSTNLGSPASALPSPQSLRPHPAPQCTQNPELSDSEPPITVTLPVGVGVARGRCAGAVGPQGQEPGLQFQAQCPVPRSLWSPMRERKALLGLVFPLRDLGAGAYPLLLAEQPRSGCPQASGHLMPGFWTALQTKTPRNQVRARLNS